jgi:hypothetical protein
MSPPLLNETEAGDTILFRPSKKRKIYRQRSDSTEDVDQASAPASTTPVLQSLDELLAAADAEGEVEGTQVSMAEILRLRKQRRPKIGGVEFKTSGTLVRDDQGVLVVRGPEEVGEEGEAGGMEIVHRFAPQTGTVGDVNKHM